MADTVMGDYEWLGARLRLGMPDAAWFARLDDLLGIAALDVSSEAENGEITVLSDTHIHSYADHVNFANAPDLLIWLALTISDVLAEKKGAFLLHAACFVLDGTAVLVFGSPFAGKSTLTAMALERGIEVLGDDIVHLEPETGLAQAVPRPLKQRVAAEDIVAQGGAFLTIGAPLYGTLDGEPCLLAPRARRGIYHPVHRFPVRGSIFLSRHHGAGVRLFEPDRFTALACLLDWARDWSTPPLACAHRAAKQLLALRYAGVSVGDDEQEAALDAILRVLQ